MADDGWKTRVGFKINYDSDDEKKTSPKVVTENPKGCLKGSEMASSVESSSYFDETLAQYDELGTTPPRTRISRRLRERKQRDNNSPKCRGLGMLKFSRRNTIDTLYIDELIQKADGNSSDQDIQLRRVDKKNKKLLRESERDLKLGHHVDHRPISLQPSLSSRVDLRENRADSMPNFVPQYHVFRTPTLIETCNRFMSLTSKPVLCRWKEKSKCFSRSDETSESLDCPEDRVTIYKQIWSLLRTGLGEKGLVRKDSQEDNMWQNKIQDLIWLELQARKSDRTLTEQDSYLCAERENVKTLLLDIMKYRFERPSPKFSSSVSTTSSDSGVETNANAEITDNETSLIKTEKALPVNCWGCLSLFCSHCMTAQNHALREVEAMLEQLETAEALFPSSKAFALSYPIYKSEKFVGRVKAMCLWYNLMKHQRFKLIILSKLITLQNRCDQPNCPLDLDSPTPEGIHHFDLDRRMSSDSKENVRRNSHHRRHHHHRNHQPLNFDFDSSSPSDSNNSTASSGFVDDDVHFMASINLFNIEVINNLEKVSSQDGSLFRKYIESVLKTRELRKAINLLENLQRTILRKVHKTLEKPPLDEPFEIFCKNKCQLKETDGADEIDECELRRYGCCSPEAQELNLPSYRAAFLFLSLIPLHIIHEFMKMRLEHKPSRLSPLSIRQSMRELKEGLKIAISHRERIILYINTTLNENERGKYHEKIADFDQTVKAVLEMYLDYLEQWSLMIQHESFQKSMLEDEWSFVRSISNHIPNTHAFIGQKFCSLVGTMLTNIGKTLQFRVQELDASIHSSIAAEDDSDERYSMLLVCRELQRVINEERESSLKAIAFSKTLRKDLRSSNFGTDENAKTQIRDSFSVLKDGIISLREQLTAVIKQVDKMCDISKTNMDLDENEWVHLKTRCREILHQAFKFGFDIYMMHQIDLNEYAKEQISLPDHFFHYLACDMLHFAKLWINFVLTRCERGRGHRPRWPNQGLDFLALMLEPYYSKHLSSKEFQEFHSLVKACVDHIIGEANTPTIDIVYSSAARLANANSFPRSRGSSPQPRLRTTSRSNKDGIDQPDVANPADLSSKASFYTGRKSNSLTIPSNQIATKSQPERVLEAVTRLDASLDEKLRSNDLIGRVTATHSTDRIYIKSRLVTFSWQRGIKIGQGSFGKVYTAVNNKTGELLAMKEIALQPNDHKMIKRVAEEIKLFEGIQHKHLIRYYGVEIHRDEMLIFMEFCNEGTLESLVAAIEGGLPETLIRRYTCQLLSAVAALHQHSVVHRDIKSANIFLTNEGNCLKLGDFGSAAKIKAHTTMPGELLGFVGTQAYMAPEVFMKMNAEGHGRAADIWSVGCVVIEMATGKRPWHQYDSNYQIMYVVGTGTLPEIPSRLSEEGQEFLDRCFQYDPKERATAEELQQHYFAKIDDVL